MLVDRQDTRHMLDEIRRFARERVAVASARPEHPVDEHRIASLSHEAASMGLLPDASAGQGFALWEHPTDAESTVFSVGALRHVATANAAIAFAWHRTALAHAVARALDLALPSTTHPLGVTITPYGHFGLARGALGRWLRDVVGPADHARLEDWLDRASHDTTLFACASWQTLLWPVWRDGAVHFACEPREALDVVRARPAHGLDELGAFTVRARTAGHGGADASASAVRAIYAKALAADGLAMMAIAQGALQRGASLASDFAAVRRQGGRVIAEHPAVQRMQSDIAVALQQADVALSGFERALSDIALHTVAAARASVHPALCRAANQVMQVHGGIGYMRDAGAERVVRDLNMLALQGGGPMAAHQLLAASLDQAATDRGYDARNDNSRSLDGHLPSSHPLSPRQTYRDLPPVGQFLSDYAARDLWDEDTQRLPWPLARQRRRARDFAARRIAPIADEVDLAPHPAPGDCHPLARALLADAGREGWLSYFMPRPLGSMPWSTVAYPAIWQCSLIVEEFAAACGGLMLLLSAHHLGAMPLLLAGNGAQVLGHLRRVYAACERGDPHVMAFAITEPGAGSDAEDGHGASLYQPGVVATPVRGGWLLNGRKCYISGGDLAKSVTVFAALQGEGMASWTCFLVHASTPGYRVARTELKMGMRASGAAELEFENVFVPHEHVVGALRQGWTINRATLNASRIPVAAMGVGFARAATECALEFARTYALGGKTLLNYQEVQLHLATMVAEVRAMRSLVWQEARHAWQPRQLHASLAKFHATDRAQRVCEMALELVADHGGLHERRVEKIFRDVRLTRIFEGTNQVNRLSMIEDWQDQLLAADPSPGV